MCQTALFLSEDIMRTQRQLRVGEEIKHAISSILLRGDAPLPPEFRSTPITVSEVRISPDLKNASIFIIPLGGKKLHEIVEAMNDNIGFFRFSLAKAVSLKFVPVIRFFPDNSFDEANKIEQILHSPEVSRDLKKE